MDLALAILAIFIGIGLTLISLSIASSIFFFGISFMIHGERMIAYWRIKYKRGVRFTETHK